MKNLLTQPDETVKLIRESRDERVDYLIHQL